MIDIHTHLWPAQFSPAYMQAYWKQKKDHGQEHAMTAAGLLDSMDRSGIDRAVISTLALYKQMTNEELDVFHDYVGEQTEQGKGRLAAFCTVAPLEEDAVEAVKRRIQKEGFVGLKLHPNLQEFYPDDKRIYPVYEWMEKQGIPVLFHTGGIGLSGVKDCFGAPERMDHVACDFPELPIIMGHAGRISDETTAMLLRKHPQVYADISTNFGRMPGVEWKQLERLLETVKIWCGNTDKLLLGSDYPFYSQEDTVVIVRELQRRLEQGGILEKEDIEGVLDRNGERFCLKYKIFKEEKK